MKDTLVSVDAGKRYLGWAFFIGGQLRQCGFFHPDQPFADHNGVQCGMRILYQIVDDLDGEVGVDRYIGESPDHRGYNERANFNENIRPLCHTAAMAAGVLCDEHSRIQLPAPHTWKGTVDGDAFIERAFRQLEPEEKLIVARAKKALGLNAKDTSDMADAVCLGLWGLGRLHKYDHDEPPPTPTPTPRPYLRRVK